MSAVSLSDARRDRLDAPTRTGRTPAQAIRHARAPPPADAPDDGPARDDERIAAASGQNPAALARARERFGPASGSAPGGSTGPSASAATGPPARRSAPPPRPVERRSPVRSRPGGGPPGPCGCPPTATSPSARGGRPDGPAGRETASRETARRTPEKTCRVPLGSGGGRSRPDAARRSPRPRGGRSVFMPSRTAPGGRSSVRTSGRARRSAGAATRSRRGPGPTRGGTARAGPRVRAGRAVLRVPGLRAPAGAAAAGPATTGPRGRTARRSARLSIRWPPFEEQGLLALTVTAGNEQERAQVAELAERARAPPPGTGSSWRS